MATSVRKMMQHVNVYDAEAFRVVPRKIASTLAVQVGSLRGSLPSESPTAPTCRPSSSTRRFYSPLLIPISNPMLTFGEEHWVKHIVNTGRNRGLGSIIQIVGGNT